jgi:hypothetical protein
MGWIHKITFLLENYIGMDEIGHDVISDVDSLMHVVLSVAANHARCRQLVGITGCLAL